MLIFKNVKYKNFLATGNKMISIDLNKDGITLVTGSNGSGKSTVISAIYYAIYGKPFSGVNKSEVINSINKTNMLIELELEQNMVRYVIRRGQKPSLFEIYVNGVLKPIPANVKDYQNWLIEQVIHMDEKTFRQTCVLGSTSYIPFMRLNSLDRRTVIEDILDIDVFSSMNVIAKANFSKIKNDVTIHETSIEKLKYKIDAETTARQKVIDNLNQSLLGYNEKIKEYVEQLNHKKKELEDLTGQLKNADTSSIRNIKETILKKEEENKRKTYNINRNISDNDRNIKFFEEHDVCPTCHSILSEDFRKEKIDGYTTNNDEEKEKISNILKENEALHNKLNQVETLLSKYEGHAKNGSNIINSIKSLQSNIELCKTEREKIKQKLEEHEKTEDESLDNYKKELNLVIDELSTIKQQYNDYDTILGLLKDNGIKSLIVKQYIQTINILIKKYLDIIGFNITFSFDEGFNETIKSRGRDEFEYASMSEGERFRIDICVLFAFIEISKMRSSSNTNLLFVDEKDGVLDTDGASILETLFRSFNGNVFFVTHNPEFYRDFANKELHFEKVNNFSNLI